MRVKYAVLQKRGDRDRRHHGAWDRISSHGECIDGVRHRYGAGAALDRFYHRGPWSMGFAKRSAGILVFPNIVKAGFGFGGEYGEGSLMIRGHPAEYYNTVSASFGFQLGAQARSVIIMFMTPDALEGFRRKDGWKVWRLGPDGEPVEPWPAFRIPDDVIWMERFSILL